MTSVAQPTNVLSPTIVVSATPLPVLHQRRIEWFISNVESTPIEKRWVPQYCGLRAWHEKSKTESISVVSLGRRAAAVGMKPIPIISRLLFGDVPTDRNQYWFDSFWWNDAGAWLRSTADDLNVTTIGLDMEAYYNGSMEERYPNDPVFLTKLADAMVPFWDNVLDCGDKSVEVWFMPGPTFAVSKCAPRMLPTTQMDELYSWGVGYKQLSRNRQKICDFSEMNYVPLISLAPYKTKWADIQGERLDKYGIWIDQVECIPALMDKFGSKDWFVSSATITK